MNKNESFWTLCMIVLILLLFPLTINTCAMQYKNAKNNGFIFLRKGNNPEIIYEIPAELKKSENSSKVLREMGDK